MIQPDDLLHIAEGAEEVAEDLHLLILALVIERITIRAELYGGQLIFSATDKQQIQTLQEAGLLLADIQTAIDKKTPFELREIRDAMERAGVETVAYDNEIYRAAGILPPLEDALPEAAGVLPPGESGKADGITGGLLTPREGGMSEETAAEILLQTSPHYVRTMERIYHATEGEWRNFTRTMPQAGHDLYIQACDKAHELVQSGAMSYTEAYSQAINEAAKGGVKVTYPSGHKDTIETATLRAVRTATAQTSEEISLMRAKEMGTSLRLTSSHLGARPEHEKWQGEVFWVDWDLLGGLYPGLASVPNPTPATDAQKAKYREFCTATGIGTVTGLAGVNCRHTSSVYIEGVSHNPFTQYDEKENKKVYDLTQRQRAMERAIRKQKREVMGLKAAVDKAQNPDLRESTEGLYSKAAAKLGRMNQEYNAFCKANNLRPLPERLEVARWDREQARAAVKAARKAGSK